MVFNWQDGEVLLVYAVALWARDCHTLYANGYVSGHGNGGRSYTWEVFLRAYGIYSENETATGMHVITNDAGWERIDENRKMLGITDEMGKDKNKIA